MITAKKDELRFLIARSFASSELDNRHCNFSPAYIFDQLRDKDLEDARCLLRMITKEVEAHNSAIRAKLTLLRNLRYSSKWILSKLFSGLNIPYRKIDEMIAANPDTDYYEIYKKMIGR